jgi:hypothetical protein
MNFDLLNFADFLLLLLLELVEVIDFVFVKVFVFFAVLVGVNNSVEGIALLVEVNNSVEGIALLVEVNNFVEVIDFVFAGVIDFAVGILGILELDFDLVRLDFLGFNIIVSVKAPMGSPKTLGMFG